eukprot:XP_001708081.1 Hypothetical protein GL50803_3285 [Giardia lamblia ATCC 50803]
MDFLGVRCCLHRCLVKTYTAKGGFPDYNHLPLQCALYGDAGDKVPANLLWGKLHCDSSVRSNWNKSRDRTNRYHPLLKKLQKALLNETLWRDRDGIT